MMRLVSKLLLPIVAGVTMVGCSEAPSFDRMGEAASLAKAIANEEDHVTVPELADWLIKDQRDFVLVDVRDARDYASGHIEGAINLPLAGLMSDASMAEIPAGQKVVVYSNGTGHAAQAALLLRLVERDGYALLGGFNYWQAYLNDPNAARFDEMDPKQRAAYQAVACRFAGDYVAEAGLIPEGVTKAPAPNAASADPLGLGLGLGLGTPAVQQTTPAPQADPLGLGLGLGLGTDEVKESEQKPSQGRLLIKAEC
jgi:rhodanese-related sulfurtransferase